jgi:hypothetical protein
MPGLGVLKPLFVKVPLLVCSSSCDAELWWDNVWIYSTLPRSAPLVSREFRARAESTKGARKQIRLQSQISSNT